MHPIRKQRLFIVLFIVFGSALVIGLALFVLRENLNLFYPPSKIANGEAPHGRTIKAGGCVVPGSVQRYGDSLDVFFSITDGMASVDVKYSGILPDLFSEGEAAIVDGKLESNGVFMATRVLAKHDENYTPVEVADSLNSAAGATAIEHAKTCKGLEYGS